MQATFPFYKAAGSGVTMDGKVNVLWGNRDCQQRGMGLAVMDVPCHEFFACFAAGRKGRLSWKAANTLLPAATGRNIVETCFGNDPEGADQKGKHPARAETSEGKKNKMRPERFRRRTVHAVEIDSLRWIDSRRQGRRKISAPNPALLQVPKKIHPGPGRGKVCNFF